MKAPAKAAMHDPLGPPAPIVPRSSIAGRSLVAVVAIMTFLAALTAGAVQLVSASATDWSSEVSREITIQVRPTEGRDIEAEIAKAIAAARATVGVVEASSYGREETERMLAPWLGEGADLSDLPIPRLIVIRLATGTTPDLKALRARLAADVIGASLDDHRFWVERLSTMAATMVFAGIGILVLMIAATALSVMFATRGAMAGNREVIEVLHFVGADDRFIARQFQTHFLKLGFEGGIIGGIAAIAVLLVGNIFASRFVATASGDQLSALFGTFSLGVWGYLAIVATVILVAFMAAFTSRLTVYRVLREQGG